MGGGYACKARYVVSTKKKKKKHNQKTGPTSQKLIRDNPKKIEAACCEYLSKIWNQKYATKHNIKKPQNHNVRIEMLLSHQQLVAPFTTALQAAIDEQNKLLKPGDYPWDLPYILNVAKRRLYGRLSDVAHSEDGLVAAKGFKLAKSERFFLRVLFELTAKKWDGKLSLTFPVT